MNPNNPNSDEHNHSQPHDNTDVPKYIREDEENNYTQETQGHHDHDEHLEQTTNGFDKHITSNDNKAEQQGTLIALGVSCCGGLL